MKISPGPDGVLTVLLVAAVEYRLQELTKRRNMGYNHGCVSEELNKSICIFLPKISGTAKYEKNISLISHTTKFSIRVVMIRVRGRTLQDPAPEQYGFIPENGTRNVIFVLRRMPESIEKQKDIICIFID